MIRTKNAVSDATNEPIVTQSGENHIVIGDFSLDGTCTSQHVTTLVHHLRQSERNISTFSKSGPTFAQNQLEFHTQRRFLNTQKTLKSLTRTPYITTIYLSEFAFSNITKRNWGGRRKEEWRRCVTAVKLVWNAQNAIIVTSTEVERTIGFLLCALAPFGTRTYQSKITPRQLYRKISGKIAKPTTVKEAEESLTYYSNKNRTFPPMFAIRTTADRLERTSPERAALIKDLRDIFEVSTRLKRNNSIPLIEQIRVCPQTRTFNTKACTIANQMSKHAHITEYMHHLNTKLLKPVDLESSNAAMQFKDWYISARENQKSAQIHPIPSEMLTQDDSNFDRHKNIELLLRFAHRVDDLGFVHADTLNYLKQPLGQEDGNLTRMELLCALSSRVLPQTKTTFLEPWKADDIRNWFISSVIAVAPELHRFSSHPATDSPACRPKIEVLGVNETGTGLASNTLMSAKSIRICQEQYNVEILKSAVIHHVNADRIPQQVLQSGKGFHIGFLLWELETVPEAHRLAGKILNEIWVPSEYLRKIYAHEFGRKITNIGKGLTLQPTNEFKFSRYGIPKDCFVFAICFDAHSSVERKNPLAAVKAFQLAFSGETKVRLIIKTTPVSKSHWGDPNGQMRQIRKIAARDKRIVIIGQMFQFTELMSLIASADCIVSSHRAEGFGYIPAYSLGYGTPVITTDYSGTKDFCNSSTSFPVSFSHVEVKSNESILPVKNAYWAEIHVEKLASSLIEVWSDPTAAKAKASVGRALITSQYSPEKHAKRYYNRLQEIGIIR